MAETKYTYSIQNDTPNHQVNSDTLGAEIRANTGITIALSHIDTSGDVLDVWMRDALPTEQETVLDGVIAAHSGAPSPEEILRTTTVGLSDMTGRSMYRRSFPYVPLANTDNLWHAKFTSNLGLQGGEYKVVGTPTWGDYLEMMVTDEDNVLDYGAGFVIRTFVEKEYIFEGACLSNFVTPDASTLPPYLYLTFRYVSVGEAVPQVVVRYNFRRVP